MQLWCSFGWYSFQVTIDAAEGKPGCGNGEKECAREGRKSRLNEECDPKCKVESSMLIFIQFVFFCIIVLFNAF